MASQKAFKMSILTQTLPQALREWRSRFEKASIRESRHLIERLEGELKRYDRKLALREVHFRKHRRTRTPAHSAPSNLDRKGSWEEELDERSRMNGEGPVTVAAKSEEVDSLRRGASHGNARSKTHRHARRAGS